MICRRLIKILSILLILAIRLYATDSTEISTSGHSNDDSMLKEILHKVEIMNEASENIRLKLDLTNARIEKELTEMKNYFVESLIKDLRSPRSENVTLTNALRKHHTITMDVWQSQKDILMQEFKHIMHEIINRTNHERQVEQKYDKSLLMEEFQMLLKRTQEEKCKHSEDFEISDYLLRLPRNCAEALKYGGKSGIYKIYLRESDLPPFNVYCLEDPMGDAPWLVMQRRKDGSVDFYRDWKDYKNGFGDQNGEFFLGLEKIHALTSAQSQELWIEMSDFSDETRFAKYDSFRIGDENSSYELQHLGKYRGKANDSFRTHEGKKFTTKDSDNDLSESANCAELYKGGWWYNKCHDSNLNGLYLRGSYSEEQRGEGITWFDWRGNLYSLKYVHMAIRERK